MLKVNLDKAKAFAHEKRRAARDAEFKPLDDIIAKRIPDVSAEEAEARRQRIRDKYAEIQDQIDRAATLEDLALIVRGL